MSGHKRATISLSQEEYGRLCQAESDLRQLNKGLETRLVENRQASEQALRSELDKAELRQHEFQQVINQLSGEVKDMEWATGQIILEQQANFCQAFEHLARDLATETVNAITAESSFLRHQMENERQQRQEQFEQLKGEVNALVGSQRRKLELASTWVQAAGSVCEFIHTHYAHELFTPHQLERLESEVQQARANLSQGLPEAALACAQQAYQRLSYLRIDLEQLQNEWTAIHQAAWEKAVEIYQVALENQVCQAKDLQGNELPFELDVNYWSEGALEGIIIELETLIQRLETDEPHLDTQQLVDLMQKTLPGLHDHLVNIVFLARLALLNSQLRINIADVAVQALETQGYVLQQSSYLNQDMLRGYSASLKNFEGCEVEVCVDPVPGAASKNELHIRSFDRVQRSQHELRQRSQEVLRSLRLYGLDVGALTALPETVTARENPALYRTEPVKKAIQDRK